MVKKYIIGLENDQIINGHIACPMQIGYRDRPSFFIDTGIDIAHYTEPDLDKVKGDAYIDGYKAGREAEKVRQPDLEHVKKVAYEQGRKDGKIEGRAEVWVYIKKIAEIIEKMSEE